MNFRQINLIFSLLLIVGCNDTVNTVKEKAHSTLNETSKLMNDINTSEILGKTQNSLNKVKEKSLRTFDKISSKTIQVIHDVNTTKVWNGTKEKTGKILNKVEEGSILAWDKASDKATQVMHDVNATKIWDDHKAEIIVGATVVAVAGAKYYGGIKPTKTLKVINQVITVDKEIFILSDNNSNE